MMRIVRMLATGLVAISLSASVAVAQDRIVLAQAKKQAAVRNVGTHVYLLRGFMDVFSTGMDDLGVKLNRRGIRATVHGHAEYHNLAEEIASRYRSGQRENVVIIGHSLGANAAFQMAERLGDYKITVPLIISYDPTAAMSVSGNVSRVVNFYSSTNGWGSPIVRGPGFRGSLSNVDLSRRGEMGHTDIDKSPYLHSQSIGYIQSIGGGSTSTTERPASDAKDKQSTSKPESENATQTSPAASAPLPATNDMTATTGAVSASSAGKSSDTKPADAKPAGVKTETAASPAAESSTKN